MNVGICVKYLSKISKCSKLRRPNFKRLGCSHKFEIFHNMKGGTTLIE